MVSVSLCMIVKNEEDVLGRCLDSAAELVDEIVIVDTGSTDRTREIAARYTDKIFDFPWRDDFAAARNESFSHATMDYCLWLDADDILLEEDQEKFRALKEELDPGVSVVMAPYHTGFDESGRVTFSYYRERLIKNRAGMHWVGAVHEVVPPVGKVLYGDFAVTHRKTRPSDPDRNLRIYQAQLDAGEALEPRHQFYYGRELYYHKRWEEALEVFERFLEEGRGWVENNIDACCHCAYCHRELGGSEAALAALFRTFVYDRPRAVWAIRKKRRPLMSWPPPVNRILRRSATTGQSFRPCRRRQRKWSGLPAQSGKKSLELPWLQGFLAVSEGGRPLTPPRSASRPERRGPPTHLFS